MPEPSEMKVVVEDARQVGSGSRDIWAKTGLSKLMNARQLSVYWSGLTPSKSADEWEALFRNRIKESVDVQKHFP